MTAILELKQKMKEFYGEHDTWILPLLKFVLAFVLFKGINSYMGFSDKMDNIFIVLILAVLCSILPLNAMTAIACVIVVGQCYSVGIEAAGFALILMILLMILFLRFTSRENLAMVLTPIAFRIQVPAAVPIGCGLLRGISSAVPAGCGIVLYHFMRLIKDKAALLQAKDTEIVKKLQILLDGLVKNYEMWLTVLVFIIVVIVVFLIRKLPVNYSWRIAIVAGAVVYILAMTMGSMVLRVQLDMTSVIVNTVLSTIISFVLEFFVLGVDYSRSEVTQFEDDEYVYYVKAVPKALITGKQKSVKTISNEEEEYEEPKFEREPKVQQEPEEISVPPVMAVDSAEIDFEKQLEESLKDL